MPKNNFLMNGDFANHKLMKIPEKIGILIANVEAPIELLAKGIKIMMTGELY
jgi:hypothetical protein